MTSFWERLLGRKETSAHTARERLKLVLVTDRSELSPERLAQMQAEIIDVIKRYINIDDAGVKIKLEQRARDNYLVADIPLVRNPGSLESVALGDAPIVHAEPVPSAPEVTSARPADASEVPQDAESAADGGDEESGDATDGVSSKAPETSSTAQDTSPTPPRQSKSR